MRRRDLSKILFASAAGTGIAVQTAQAQVGCVVPCTPQTPEEAAAGVTPADEGYVPGDIRRYGAMGNGTHDDTAAIQTAVNLGYGTPIPIPPVAWRLTRSVVVPSNRTISGTRGRSKLTFVSGSFPAFTVTSASNVTFDSLVGESAADSLAHPFIFITGSRDVTVQGCKVTNAKIVEAWPSQLDYGAVNDGNSSARIRVLNNTMRGTRLDGSGSIGFYYVIVGEITGNEIDNATGIQLWGGDSNPSVHGALANERKCRGIVITGNKVTGCNFGIFGSMLQRSSITGNQVFGCADVGIDVEGCFDISITGNVSRDCINGCYATFSLNRNIVFSGNSASTSNAAWLLLRIYNISQGAENRDVAFYGNTFRGIGVIGTIDNGNGPAAALSFEGNDLVNAQISFAHNNSALTRIIDNNLLFDVSAPAAFIAIDAGNTHPSPNFSLPGNLTIRGNSVVSMVSQPSGSVGIRAQQIDRSLSIIDDNYLSNWTTDIQTTWSGANAGVAGRFLVRRNIMESYVRTENGAAPSVVVLEDNRRRDGSVFT